MIRRPPRSTLFPYTRSSDLGAGCHAPIVARRFRNVQVRVLITFDIGSRSMCAYLDRCPRCSTRSEEHTSELQSLAYLVCRLLVEKKKKKNKKTYHIKYT